jgi:hypothetical protein
MRAAMNAAVMAGRKRAEALMVDTVRVERESGTTLDPDTLEEVPAYTTVYEGKARVQRAAGLTTQDRVVGGYEVGVGTLLAQLPLSALGVKRGDRFTVAAVDPVTDPDLLGVTATVQANLTKTHPTKRTLICEEVT